MVDAAGTRAVRSHVTEDLGIPGFTPSSAEGVLDDPVGNVVGILAHANKKNNMVNFCPTIKRADNTA